MMYAPSEEYEGADLLHRVDIHEPGRLVVQVDVARRVLRLGLLERDEHPVAERRVLRDKISISSCMRSE